MDLPAAVYPHKLSCRECNTETRHDTIHSREVSLVDEGEIVGKRHLLIVECRGCGENAVAIADHLAADAEPTISTYPQPAPAGPRGRREIDVDGDLPDDVAAVYSETITVFNTDSYRGTGILLRTLIEAICADRRCAGARLVDKIDALVAQGLLSKAEGRMLHLLRYMGNEAAHSGREPEWDEVEYGLDIIEHLLKTVYEVFPKAEELERAHQKRERAKERRRKAAAQR